MTALKKIAFIINPIAGRRKNSNLEDIVRKHIDKKVWEPDFYYTECRGHATDLVQSCYAGGIQTVVAAGGDGTVNEVASSAFKYGLEFGIIPCGSGNGLARSLNIPINLVGAINCINKGNSIYIDVGKINNKNFFCTCGIGFDARIGHKFAEHSKRGLSSYIKIILKEYFRYKPKKFKLRINEEKYKKKAFLVTVANAGQWGNNAYIAPKALMNDGLFDVCIFKPFPWYTTPVLGLRLFSRSMDKSRYVETIQARKVVFRKKKEYKMHIDGEPVLMKGPVRIENINKGLKIIC